MRLPFKRLSVVMWENFSRKRKIVLGVFAAVPALHLLFVAGLWLHYQSLTNGAPFPIAELNVSEKHQLQIIGSFGDVFDPKKYHTDFEFDLVPVTAVINPINENVGTIVWEHTDLLRSALRMTASDPEVFQKLVKELIVTMSSSGNLISHFLFAKPGDYKPVEYELRQASKLYFWDVPKNGPFYEKTRIDKIAAFPLFNPSALPRQYKGQGRLEDNLKIGVNRVFTVIGQEKVTDINSVAFAALAGTTRRQDSHEFLNYRESFFTIYEALKKAKIPEHVDKVYMVVYDGLQNKNEEKDALAGLFNLYRYAVHFELPGIKVLFAPYFLRAIPFALGFLIVLVWTNPKRPRMMAEGKRAEFVFEALAYSTAALPLIAAATHIALLAMEYNFLFTLALELTIAYTMYRFFVWLKWI